MTKEEQYQTEYGQANDWAIHYSNVRMALVPGLVGLSLTILGFNWPEDSSAPNRNSVMISALLWVIAFVILWIFTALEVRENWYAKLLRIALLGKSIDEDTSADRKSNQFNRKLKARFGNKLPNNKSGKPRIPDPVELSRPDHKWLRDPFSDIPFWIGTLLTAAFLYIAWSWVFPDPPAG